MTFQTIAANDIKLTVKDKMFFFWFLLFPVLFAVIMGLAFPESSSQTQKALICVLDHDKSFLSQKLIEDLKTDRYEIKVLQDEAEKEVRTLIIPENFAVDIISGQKVELILEKDEENNLQASQAAYSHILKSVIKLIARLVKIMPENETSLERDYSQGEIKRLVSLRSEMAGKLRTIPSGFNHTIPAVSVMFVLFTVLMYGGIIILQERRDGQLERIILSPATYTSIICGKWLSRIVLGMAQIAILFIAGKLLFKTYYGHSWGGIFLVALFFSGAISGLSVFLGSIIRKEESLIVTNILVANIMAGLGGCWFPLEVIPPGIKIVSFSLPTGWAMDAFNKLIFFGYGFHSIMLNIAVLGGYTLLFLFLGIKFFKVKRV